MTPMVPVHARVLRRQPPRFLGVLLVVGSVLGVPAAALADQQADAEKLIQEAKALTAAKRHAEACAKLTESQRLDPKTGTLLLLATCHQSDGKLGLAWAEFNQLASAAEKEKRTDQ